MFDVVEKIGKYEIRQEIGRGATSVVYLGFDPFMNRDVAIKVFEPIANANSATISLQRKGFLTEAALVGKLTHPHIVDILDAAYEGEKSYIVMDYINGGNLEAHNKVQTLLPVGKVVEIIFKCVRALSFAMQRGIIHRDIKPGNILLTKDGEIKITDFGAAIQQRSGDTTVDAKLDEDRIGSPAYMSPEQIIGENLTHQTDIYSLGVMMYHLLTGKLPFIATNQMGLSYAILNMEAQRPSTHRPNLPPILDLITMKAMARNKKERYLDWVAFGKDLTAAFDDLRADLRGNDNEASDAEQFEALRALPFFGNFDDAELWEVVRISRWQEVKEGDVLIREGSDGDGLFVLVDGEVEVSLRGTKINTIKRGGCFGEMVYFSDHHSRRSTTITAKTECDVIEIKAKAIDAASDGVQAEFNKACMHVLIDRLSQMNTRLAVLKAGQQA